jgi:hypothetical protein
MAQARLSTREGRLIDAAWGRERHRAAGAGRGLGQKLKETEKARRGPDSDGQGSQRTTSDAPTLRDIGITKQQSSDHKAKFFFFDEAET